jgi:hypothetical protein
VCFAVVGATLVVALLDLPARDGLSVLGRLPQGLPLPDLAWQLLAPDTAAFADDESVRPESRASSASVVPFM